MVSRFNKLSRKCVLMLIAPLGLLLAFLASRDRAIISISLKSRGEIGYPSIVGHPPLWRSTVSGDVGVLIVHCTNVPVFERYKTCLTQMRQAPQCQERVSEHDPCDKSRSVHHLGLDIFQTPTFRAWFNILCVLVELHETLRENCLDACFPDEKTILMDADTKVCASLQSILTSLDFADVSYVRQVLQNSKILKVAVKRPFSHFYSGFRIQEKHAFQVIQTAILEDSPDQMPLMQHSERLM